MEGKKEEREGLELQKSGKYKKAGPLSGSILSLFKPYFASKYYITKEINRGLSGTWVG